MLTRIKSAALKAARLLPIVLLPFAGSISAQDAQWYGELGYARTGVEITDIDFNPAIARISVGGWLKEGVGMEISHAVSASDDSVQGLDIDVSQLTTLVLRLQSPEELGIKAYMLLGYSAFTLDGTRGNAGFPGEEDFSGPMAALGFLFPLRAAAPLSISLEYSQHFSDDDLDLNMLAAGIRYGY